MECYSCIQTCPTGAISIDEEVSCARLEGRPALRIDGAKCNDCNLCADVCPMGNIALSTKGCSFCIVCKSKPSCILSGDDRDSLSNSIKSAIYFAVSKIHFLIRST